MEQFLKIVAEDIYRKCYNENTGLSDVTIVFPNRRARLFFDEWLLKYSSKPLWSPSYTTIQDLFQSVSELKSADKLKMVSILHKIYCKILDRDETLDSFWSWGELMISDFADIDRNLVDCDQLFRVLEELKEFSGIDTLDSEQKAALEYFFGEMKKTDDSSLKEKYMSIWKALGPIYTQFRETLSGMGIAYDGMIQRQAVEMIRNDHDAFMAKFPAKKYAFVGFNSLDKAEKELFRAMNKSGKAMFYWDYDSYYITINPKHEAGLFIRDNIKEFPSELKDSSISFDNIVKPKKLTIVETSTDNAQARYVPEWIHTLRNAGADGFAGTGASATGAGGGFGASWSEAVAENLPVVGKDTAIVLCDEGLLQPVLHSIPENGTEAVNITMGYPLSQTSLYSLITALTEMQRSASHNSGKMSLELVGRILGNPLVNTIEESSLQTLARLRKERKLYPSVSELTDFKTIAPLFRVTYGNTDLLKYLLDAIRLIVPAFESNTEDSLFKPMNQEAAYRIYTQLNRLHSLSDSGEFDVTLETMCRLINSVMRNGTVPFHGEPVIGLQVMGLLETRNLDFKHILLLSSSEGCLPNAGSSISFIPFNLRVAFGMTTMKEKSAVASYNFYHLLQRAETVTMVYNGNSEAPGMGKGQISRYLLQLITDSKFGEIKRISQSSDRGGIKNLAITVKKEGHVLDNMLSKYDSSLDASKPMQERKFLSPSAINKYIDCPLKFYLAQIAKLNEPDTNDVEIAPNTFGTIFHKSAELAYEMLASQTDDRTITKDNIAALLKDSNKVREFVQQAFKEDYFNNADVPVNDYSGTQNINYEVIVKYLVQVLTLDRDHYAPFKYIGGETNDYQAIIEVPDPRNVGMNGPEGTHTGGAGELGSSTVPIRLAGIIDRLDSRIDAATGKEIVRIVDYKTGTKYDYPSSIDDLFQKKGNKKRCYQALQICYYAYILSQQDEFRDKLLAPVLLYTRATSKAAEESIYYQLDKKPLIDFKSQCMPDYEEHLVNTVREIFDPSVPFTQTEDLDTCDHCEFINICKRPKKHT